MRTTLLISSSSHGHWETFALNNVSPSFSFHTNVSKEFEDMVASSAMIRFSPMSIENKRIIETTNLIFTFKGNLMVLS